MKKIIPLTSLLAVSAAALTPVMMTQNMSKPKSSFGHIPPPTPSGYMFVSDFEKNIGDSLWNKIEAYINSKSTATLELSFQYNGNWSHPDGFYTNASWPH